MPATVPFSIDPEAVYPEWDIRLALGLTSATLTRARRQRKLRFSRQGNVILYRGQWLIDWLEADAKARQEGAR